jgi:hypothetical protein
MFNNTAAELFRAARLPDPHNKRSERAEHAVSSAARPVSVFNAQRHWVMFIDVFS